MTKLRIQDFNYTYTHQFDMSASLTLLILQPHIFILTVADKSVPWHDVLLSELIHLNGRCGVDWDAFCSPKLYLNYCKLHVYPNQPIHIPNPQKLQPKMLDVFLVFASFCVKTLETVVWGGNPWRSAVSEALKPAHLVPTITPQSKSLRSHHGYFPPNSTEF